MKVCDWYSVVCSGANFGVGAALVDPMNFIASVIAAVVAVAAFTLAECDA